MSEADFNKTNMTTGALTDELNKHSKVALVFNVGIHAEVRKSIKRWRRWSSLAIKEGISPREVVARLIIVKVTMWGRTSVYKPGDGTQWGNALDKMLDESFGLNKE